MLKSKNVTFTAGKGKDKTPVVNRAFSQLCVCRAVLISVSRPRAGSESQLSYMGGRPDLSQVLPFTFPATSPVPYYTAWWQRHMCVNNLPNVVTWQCTGLESNRGPPVYKSETLPLYYQATTFTLVTYKFARYFKFSHTWRQHTKYIKCTKIYLQLCRCEHRKTGRRIYGDKVALQVRRNIPGSSHDAELPGLLLFFRQPTSDHICSIFRVKRFDKIATSNKQNRTSRQLHC